MDIRSGGAIIEAEAMKQAAGKLLSLGRIVKRDRERFGDHVFVPRSPLNSHLGVPFVATRTSAAADAANEQVAAEKA